MTDRTIIDSRFEDFVFVGFMVAGAVLCCMAGMVIMNLAFGSPTSNDDIDFEIYLLNQGLYSNQIDFYIQNISHVVGSK